MDDVMRRGRSQTIWRYTPGAVFRYGESGAWCQTSGITLRDPKPPRGALVSALHQALSRWDALQPSGYFPDPQAHAEKYAVGTPYQLEYDLWPLVFTCRKCGRLHYYQTLENLKRINENLQCDSCGKPEMLRQTPYAFVCECGRLETIFAPTHQRNHPLKLVNKGNFQESYWYCTVCRKSLSTNSRAGLGFRTCDCAPRKMKHGVTLEDGRVHFSQTIDIVDISPNSLDPWADNPAFSMLVLGAALRIPAYRQTHIQDLAHKKPGDQALSPEIQAMREGLLASGRMTEAEVDAIIKAAANATGANVWDKYQVELAPYQQWVGQWDWKDQRRTVEYVFVRDDPSTSAIPLDQLIEEAKTYGDAATEARLTQERQLAEQMGLVNLHIVQALPILLAGVGFTRYKQNPNDTDGVDGARSTPTRLRPYNTQADKIPIYVARNDTEALLFEMDPWRLAAFLRMNTGTAIPSEAYQSTPSIRAWLVKQCARLLEIEGESHLVLKPWEIDRGQTVDVPSALAFGVLHTMSHVLKATAHRYVGIDSDALAEYLFPAHAAGLLYASSQVEFTLGGLDSVFRSNLSQWLGSARDHAGQCSFDPVCEQSGGACLACLYPKFGCGYFNRTLSRAFLVGGQVNGLDRPIEGFWSAAVTKETAALRAKASAP